MRRRRLATGRPESPLPQRLTKINTLQLDPSRNTSRSSRDAAARICDACEFRARIRDRRHDPRPASATREPFAGIRFPHRSRQRKGSATVLIRSAPEPHPARSQATGARRPAITTTRDGATGICPPGAKSLLSEPLNGPVARLVARSSRRSPRPEAVRRPATDAGGRARSLRS